MASLWPERAGTGGARRRCWRGGSKSWSHGALSAGLGSVASCYLGCECEGYSPATTLDHEEEGMSWKEPGPLRTGWWGARDRFYAEQGDNQVCTWEKTGVCRMSGGPGGGRQGAVQPE